MSIFRPYDADRPDLACGCGRHASAAEHAAAAGAVATPDVEQLSNDVIEEALLRAMFPQADARRNFLRAVGANTVRAAIASVLPLGALQAMAQERNGANGALEKKDLKIGFIAITCAAPLIMAETATAAQARERKPRRRFIR